jgi:uncharacterized membrane protein YfcA
MKLNQLITGIVIIAVGIFFGILSFFSAEATFIFLFWGIILLILGIYILFNRGENKIEEIKSKGRKK